MIRRTFVALSALAALGTAACSPQPPADSDEVVCAPYTSTNAQTAAETKAGEERALLARMTRRVIERDGITLEPAYDNIHLLMRANATTGKMEPIQLGQRRGVATLPDGSTRNFTYPVYAAFDESSVISGLDDRGEASYGLVAASRTLTIPVTHARMNGVTQTEGETATVPLTAANWQLLPEHLRNPATARTIADRPLSQTLRQARDITITNYNGYMHEANVIARDMRQRRAMAGRPLAVRCGFATPPATDPS